MKRTAFYIAILGSSFVWQGCFDTESVSTHPKKSSGGGGGASGGAQPTGGSSGSGAGNGGSAGTSSVGGSAGTNDGGAAGSAGEGGIGGDIGGGGEGGGGPRCGDGIFGVSETCDDGNDVAGDGCSPTCEREPGWICNDHEPTECEEECGDGRVVGKEVEAGGCDDGNTRPNDGCSALCAVESGWSCSMVPSRCREGCGDGVITTGEACDDRNSNLGDGCFACAEEAGWTCTGQPSTCRTTCGDGVRAGTELCDDHNTTTEECAYGEAACTVCDASCHSVAGETDVCGDGIVDSPQEGCDDDDDGDGDGCSGICAVEPGYTCMGAPSTCMRPPLGAALDVGDDHACAVSQSGAVKCWGFNVWGQLGLENTMNRGDNPDELLNQPPVSFGTGRVARVVAAGDEHTCVVSDDYSVKCWGRNLGDALGNDGPDRGAVLGTMGNAIPVVNLGTNRSVKILSAGGHFNCAILDNDALKCWGFGSSGRLGLGDTTDRGAPAQMGDNLPAVDLGPGHTARAVSAGNNHACAVRDDGVLFCWGFLGSGKVGTYENGPFRLTPFAVDLGTGRSAKAVAAGPEHTCAILDNGTLKCWGVGSRGRLGLGGNTDRGDDPQEMGDYLPVVNLGTSRTAKAVATGNEHTCVILDDDSVKCWGRNDNGRLGLGDAIDRGSGPGQMGDALPRVNLGTGRTAKAIAAGLGFTCALLDNDAVKCWGVSNYGQLGLGDTSTRGGLASQMGDNLPALNFGW